MDKGTHNAGHKPRNALTLSEINLKRLETFADGPMDKTPATFHGDGTVTILVDNEVMNKLKSHQRGKETLEQTLMRSMRDYVVVPVRDDED